jgi:phosphoglycerate kinase
VALGGAKVADKIGVLWALIEIADKIVIGGRMAFTFLAAMGVAVGQTQIEKSWLQVRHPCPPALLLSLVKFHEM